MNTQLLRHWPLIIMLVTANAVAQQPNESRRDPPVPASLRLEPTPQTTADSLSGDYLGQPLPGATPEVFARELVSTAATNEHSAPAFSPDGNEVFWFANRPPGPANKEWLSFARTMHQENGRWTAPTVSPFDGMLVISPDGRRAYFASKDDLWVAEKQVNHWGEPRCLGFTSRFPELKAVYMASVTRTGTLYFFASTSCSPSVNGIFRSELVNGEYARPQLLPSSINLPGTMNWTPFIAPDESYLLFSSNRPGGLDKYGDIYFSRRQVDGSWTEPVSLGEPVNTRRQEGFPGLSPDGKYLFFCRDTRGRENDVYWVDAATVPALLPVAMPPQENPK